MAFLSFLTSALMGWEPAMHWDGLVSKESLREETVGAMALGAGVGVGRRWPYGWNTWWSVMVQLELPAVLAMVA